MFPYHPSSLTLLIVLLTPFYKHLINTVLPRASPRIVQYTFMQLYMVALQLVTFPKWFDGSSISILKAFTVFKKNFFLITNTINNGVTAYCNYKNYCL